MQNEQLFMIDDDVPKPQISMSFLGEHILPPSSGVIVEGLSSEVERSWKSSSQDIPEQLIDEIKWSPRIDEADKVDYGIAICSGVLTGLIDALFVGELSFERANEWGTDHVNEFVKKVAKLEGIDTSDLKKTIKELEKKHPFVADKLQKEFNWGLHHFYDFSHHFSVFGLACSLFTQFSRVVIGMDQHGNLKTVKVPEEYIFLIGKDVPQKMVFGTAHWFLHIVSDMAGSSDAIGEGTGVPGPLVSLMTAISALPIFKGTDVDSEGFRMWVSRLFNGVILKRKGDDGKIKRLRFDLRTEIGLVGELGRQSVPVIINQCLVRGLYFLRRVFREIEELDIRCVEDLQKIALEDVLPINTPAIRRMLTVSSGVSMCIDFADAAVKARGEKDISVFFLNINYPGIAAFVICCSVEVKEALRNKNLAHGNGAEEAFERDIADLKVFALNYEEARILLSVECAMVKFDITQEKHAKRAERKAVWLAEWSKNVTAAVGLQWSDVSEFFLDSIGLYEAIGRTMLSSDNAAWLRLIVLEALCFEAYKPLYGDNDSIYKGLKMDADYLRSVFARKQELISGHDIDALAESLKKAGDSLSGSPVRIVGVLAGIAAGGLAFMFAPAVAPLLAVMFGFDGAALSGAALTSASLAFLGGGSLAAGGAGMVGGSMVISGGGALLGATGGSSATAAVAMTLATDGNYVRSECAKLIAFCGEVLSNRYGNAEEVSAINDMLSMRIFELEMKTDALKRSNKEGEASEKGEQDGDNTEKLGKKEMIKILNRSIRYLKKCKAAIEEIFKDATAIHTAIALADGKGQEDDTVYDVSQGFDGLPLLIS